MSIEAALEAAQRADWPSALRAAIAAWRAEPEPRLAAAIVQLGPRAARSITPFGGDRWTDRNKVWFAAARRGDPVELHYVLEAAGDVRGGAELTARLQKLENIDDPRIAIALKALAHDKRSWYDARRHIEARLAILDGSAPATRWDPRLDVLLAACDRAAADADDAADEAALLAAIYAAPADDGPRLVYADWLQARNDPRGELIALQTLPREGATNTTSERERGLITLHGDRWKGPLAPHLSTWGFGFARGFISWCRVEPIGADRARPPDQVAWATVTQTSGMLPPLASARALRFALELDHRELMYLATFPAPPPITNVSIATWQGDFDPRAGTWDAASREASAALAAAAPRLRALRTLELVGSNGWTAGEGMSPTQLIWPWRELGITRLAVRTAFPQLAAWIATARESSSLERLELYTYGDYGHRYEAWHAILTPGTDGTLSALYVSSGTTLSMPSARNELSIFASGLALVPPDVLTSITLLLPKRGLVEGSAEFAMCMAAVARQRRVVEPKVSHRGKT